MQASSIQYQHFWIELFLGVVMIIMIVINPLEKGLVSAIILGLAIMASRTIQRGRIISAKRAERRREQQAEIARREEARRLKKEALRQAQLEAAQKYLH